MNEHKESFMLPRRNPRNLGPADKYDAVPSILCVNEFFVKGDSGTDHVGEHLTRENVRHGKIMSGVGS